MYGEFLKFFLYYYCFGFVLFIHSSHIQFNSKLVLHQDLVRIISFILEKAEDDGEGDESSSREQAEKYFNNTKEYMALFMCI